MSLKKQDRLESTRTRKGPGSTGEGPAESVGWRTTDEHEIKNRVERALKQGIVVREVPGCHPIFGSFTAATPGSVAPHYVEIRSLTKHENTCDCPDFRINGLGTCKHVEAVLLHVKRNKGKRLIAAAERGSTLVEVYLSRQSEAPSIRVLLPASAGSEIRDLTAEYFGADGSLLADPVDALPSLRRSIAALPAGASAGIRVSREVDDWVAGLRRKSERAAAREAFLEDVAAGRKHLEPPDVKLYPYQREGALHLAFTERALLADDMGLGKTVQAIVACEILRQTRHIERVLIVTPVSLKGEWEDQIRKFCGQSVQLVMGPRQARLSQYRTPAFFNIANYEQVLVDQRDIVESLAPDVVVLDEAQRIKNWQTKVAHTIKRLSSPFAFVLTGTPLENKIDELYSIVEFLDPHLFGPLFRFNREYYQLDERGKPSGFKNLDKLHRTARSVMLRRRKDQVEEQLPPRQMETRLVPMSGEQTTRYEEHQAVVARIIQVAKRRPLRPEEFDRLQQRLACMRMLCDTPYILDPECRISPKLDELAALLDAVLASETSKVIVFSEWARMLELVRGRLEDERIDLAWHTGSVPQEKRRAEIARFKSDPACRVFLSTDSGATGLNLQVADTVINVDLPWNPAKLEQRIARAWRKQQTRTVQVYNLVSEGTIEHRMLGTLRAKQRLADGVLDGRGEFGSILLPSGGAALLERLEAVMGMAPLPVRAPVPAPQHPAALLDPLERFRQDLSARLAERLLLLEHRPAPGGAGTFLLVVDGPSGEIAPLATRLLAQVHASSPTPALEVLDRGTFELIRRLATSGVIRMDSGPVNRLHVHDALKDRAADESRLRRDAARQAFAKVCRDRKLARVMADGGFPVEALAPAAKALEAALLAAAHVLTGQALDGDPVTSDFVADTLSSGGVLSPAEAEALTSTRIALSKPAEATDDQATQLVLRATEAIRALGRYVEGD